MLRSILISEHHEHKLATTYRNRHVKLRFCIVLNNDAETRHIYFSSAFALMYTFIPLYTLQIKLTNISFVGPNSNAQLRIKSSIPDLFYKDEGRDKFMQVEGDLIDQNGQIIATYETVILWNFSPSNTHFHICSFDIIIQRDGSGRTSCV